jgi:transposase-like protein
MAVSFKGAPFPQDIILMGVRWYLAYPFDVLTTTICTSHVCQCHVYPLQKRMCRARGS